MDPKEQNIVHQNAANETAWKITGEDKSLNEQTTMSSKVTTDENLKISNTGEKQ